MIKESRSNKRRLPRYPAHLPATISLVERNVLTWDVAYTHRSRGRCETISQIGMALSLVGSRFSKGQLSKPGCSLYVTVNLPDGAIAAVVSVLNCQPPGRASGRWVVGTTISQMSESDAARLAAYIKRRATTSAPALPR